MVRRNPWLLVILGTLTIGGVVGTGVWAYWSYANELPPYTPPKIAMPVPNAFYDYRLAGTMCKAVGGSTVLRPGLGRPLPDAFPSADSPRLPGLGAIRGAVLRNGQTIQGYEDGVPLEQVRAVVARNRPALARLRQGFRKEYRSPPVVSFRQLFPELGDSRELARVLVTEGKLAEREGRMADAVRSYLDCLRLGVDVPRGGVLIHGLVGIAVQAIGLSAMERVVDRVDAPTAAAAARAMVWLDRRAPSAADILTAEKEAGTLMMRETLGSGTSWRQITGSAQRGGPSGFGFPSPSEFLAGLKFSFTPKRQIISNYRTYMDALIADARKPYYTRSTLPPLPGDVMNQLTLPVFSTTKFQWARRDALCRIVELRLAARAYQLRHGAPPPSAQVLAPEYLAVVPRDPFAPKPLVCRAKGGRAVVYSRGPDGDDDGGKDLGMRVQQGQDGDIVGVRARRRGRSGDRSVMRNP